jgi:hypothetical protein
MRNIYYISSHFMELIVYHGLSSFFRRFFPEVKQHLVLAEHPMFSLVDYEEFLEGFDSVHRLPYCDYASINRWLSQLRQFRIDPRRYGVMAFLKEARKFKFEEDSLCFVYEMTETALSVRLLLRKIRNETKHSLICRMGTCYHRSDECKTNNWISWLLHNIYVLIGAYPLSTVHLDGKMVTVRRLYQERKIMDHYLVLSNRWRKREDFVEIKYPLVVEKEPASLKNQYVLFLAQPPGLLSYYPEMSREQFITKTNQILQALTDLYKNQDVDLLFKPHPRQKDIPYDLAGFHICDKNIIAEAMYLRDRKAIRAVYSIYSSSVRMASLFEIDAYVFYELYDLPIKQRLKNYLLDFSDVVSIRSLDNLRLPQPKPDRSPSTTEQDLERLAQLFRELTNKGS